jgi:DNA-binding NarL/FixJ family response regulator
MESRDMEERRIRLLLVEDDPGDALLIRELLRQGAPFPFELTHAERLQDAVEHLAGEETDATLLDLSLPDGQGIDGVAQTLNAAPEVPLIVLTGMDDEETALQAIRAGAQDYLVKGEISGRHLAHSVRYAIERGRLERELRSLLAREKEARSAAESAVRSRDEVLGIVAHDLRDPLAAVETTVRLLLRGGIPPEQHPHQLQAVLHATRRMDRLIRDLLDAARIEGGTLHVEPQPTRVSALLAGTVEAAAARSGEAGLRFEHRDEPGIPPVLADGQRVQQVLGNLLDNALRFTPRGGTVTLGARRFGDAALLWVADSGTGIPAEDLPHLFDGAWQARHARRGGTGRGLAIARGIVEAHGGRIWAASEEGAGTTVYFTLPLDRAQTAGAGEGAPAGAAPPAESPSAAGTEGPLRVLLADDHGFLRRGLAELLRHEAGIDVVGEAATGEEALARTERLRPDVVLMDLAMPGMGGIEATRQITASMPEVRVLALTGDEEEKALMPVLRAGGSGFVRKTTAHEDLVQALATVARGEVFLYPSGTQLLLGEYLHERDLEEGPLASLNEHERQVLRLASEGFSSGEIGKKLFLSPKTVDTYRSRLMRRLGLGSRAELVQFALRTGLLRAGRGRPAPEPGSG